jgi:hypothetical protein
MALFLFISGYYLCIETHFAGAGRDLRRHGRLEPCPTCSRPIDGDMRLDPPRLQTPGESFRVIVLVRAQGRTLRQVLCQSRRRFASGRARRKGRLSAGGFERFVFLKPRSPLRPGAGGSSGPSLARKRGPSLRFEKRPERSIHRRQRSVHEITHRTQQLRLGDPRIQVNENRDPPVRSNPRI